MVYSPNIRRTITPSGNTRRLELSREENRSLAVDDLHFLPTHLPPSQSLKVVTQTAAVNCTWLDGKLAPFTSLVGTKLKPGRALLSCPGTEVWRIRVSIPVPLACKASALPFELIPLRQTRRQRTPILVVHGRQKMMKLGVVLSPDYSPT